MKTYQSWATVPAKRILEVVGEFWAAEGLPVNTPVVVYASADEANQPTPLPCITLRHDPAVAGVLQRGIYRIREA